MKKILLLLIFMSLQLHAQVGVNTTNPDPSSMLDVSATNKGVLVPRVSLANVTTTMLDGTNTAATGLLIWNTNAATVGGNGVGFYFFNGTQWMPITQSNSSDHDIYEVGGTTAPDNISDNKYTQGTLTIGTNTAATGVLDVDNATKTTSVDINNTFATNPTGIDLNLTSNAAGKTGVKTQFNGTAATGTNSFIQNTDNMVGNTNRTAINNDFSGTSSSISTSITGLKNDFKSTSNYYAVLYGVNNSFASTTNAWGYGMLNSFTNGGTTPSYGVVNGFNGTSTGSATGILNSSNNYNGSVTGMENSFSGTGNGIHYGISNSLTGTGTGDKYGIYNYIPNTAGGTHYGLYSNVLKAGSYAGYFLGNVAIGTTALNNYILPASRGTNGQIMQTDGSGNVSWATPVNTDTDNQQIDVLTLTGDTLNISLQDDGIPTQTLNLAAIDNQGTDVFSLTGTTLNLSLQNDGVATQTVNLASIDTDNQQIDVLTLTGDTLNISLQDDGVASQTVDLSSLRDADWFEVGGTNPPYSILDNKFTLGNVSIGKTTAAVGTLDVDASLKNITLSLSNTNTNLGPKQGIQNSVTVGSFNDYSYGISNSVAGNADFKYGIYNSISGAYSGGILEYGLANIHTSNGPVNSIALYNSFNPSATHTGLYTGLFNSVEGTNHTGGFLGVSNIANQSTFNQVYGMNNSLGGGGTGARFGVYNNMNGTSTGEIIGIETNISATGTGNKFGERITITNTSPGNHYGIYSNVTKVGSYAGYFLGNVSIGTTAGNSYILPASRGTNGQIMQTDGSGNVSWVNPVVDTDTDDQTTDVFSLTGTTLNLSLQNDGVATQTVDLSSLKDADWYEVGGTNSPDAITDNKFTLGDISIGKITAANGKLDVDAGLKNVTTSFTNNNATTGSKYGIQNNVTVGTNNNFSYGISNTVSGNADFKYGISNTLAGAVTGSTFEYGLVNNFLSSGAVNGFGVFNLFNPASTNSGSYTGLYNETSGTNHTGAFTGVNNIASNTSANPMTGISNTLSGAGAGVRTGVNNFISGGTLGNSYGVNNTITSGGGTKYGVYSNLNAQGVKYGVYNDLISSAGGSAISYGVYNKVNNTGGTIGAHYGVFNEMLAFDNQYGNYTTMPNGSAYAQYGNYVTISGAGTGSRYGFYTTISPFAGGTHYGIYSDATKAGSYAGYFLGNVSIGTSTFNNYILPASRGTNGQIMQTDGLGNVSWANLPTYTDTDDQGTDVFSLTGNTLNLSLQNDGVATQTVDLSSLSNDWKLTGNAGTTPGVHFIGTTDAQDLEFKTNNFTKLTLTQKGQLAITNTGGSVFVGSGAGDADDLSLNQNTFIGTVSGENTSTGNANVAVGHNSLNDNTIGFGNTAIGTNALNVNVDGNNNTGLGRGANLSTTNLSNATAIGFNSTVNASNKIRLGNTAITVIEGQVAYTNPSDARFKFDVKENVPGLDFIKKLKPVTYHFDTKKFDEHLNKNRNKSEVAEEDFSKSTAIVRTGFLAQEVEKICNDLGYNFDGLHIPDANNPTDNYGIAYSQFIMPIVKAVQEQQVIIENQKAELTQLKSQLDQLKSLEQRLEALEKSR
ncbi:tail fiber domain-containing protein [Flavobacterium sp. CYK-4]|uniref:tail fiber domain-containing protein n=1 Tax=Flavobacterium lotistagni TaxID=2709660 RepID=UPI00140D90B3|nr:tail fiber domain-containing protein [Flavobacterium lotistagni]NHM05874.1 tail fiber domain-containing protein [Flavobacterium lotistagni]